MSEGLDPFVPLWTEKFDSLVVDQEGDGGEQKDWLIHFYTDWCELCNEVHESMLEMAEILDDPHMGSNHTNFGVVDCGESPAVCDTLDIKTYPHILLVRGNPERSVYTYRGNRLVAAEIADFVRRRGEGIGVVSRAICPKRYLLA